MGEIISTTHHTMPSASTHVSESNLSNGSIVYEVYDYNKFWSKESIFESLTLGLDTSFLNMMMTKATISCVLSITCILLNFSLLVFILHTKEFRDWKFFPLCYQASIDLIGPGFANFAFEIISFRAISLYTASWQEQAFVLGNQPTNLLEIAFMNDIAACVLNVARMMLNEFTTGVCIGVTAFIRYVLICKPTSTFLTNNVLKVVSFAIILWTILATVIHALFFQFSIFKKTHHFLEYSATHGTDNTFIQNCMLFVDRRNAKVSLDWIIFMVIPAVASGYFYIRISKVLLNRELDTERNRNLSIAFGVSWLIWILLWSPNYVLMLMKKPKFTELSFGYSLYKYATVSKSFVQLLYSQINPFLLLVVLKPFRVSFKNTVRKIVMVERDKKGQGSKAVNKIDSRGEP